MAKAKKDEQENKSDYEKALTDLEKKFGLQKAKKSEVEVVPTGSYTLDIATGIGGYPKGKLIELYGQESSGKSTLVLHATTQFQTYVPDKKVALFDYEHAYDRKYAKALGVDIDNLLIYQPDNQEQGYDMIEGLLRAGLCSLIIIDSHTAAIPSKIIEGEMGDATMGLQARNNSKFLGKIKGLLESSKTTMIAISQTRVNIGCFSSDTKIKYTQL